MLNKLFVLVSILIAFFLTSCLIVPMARADEVKQVTIVNPIRGNDFWSYPHQILDTPQKEYQLINQSNLTATWLVRYDALLQPEVVTFLKSLNANQETGLFLEITPSICKDAGVTYNQSPSWHYAKSVFLIGYSPEDRKRLIDQAVKKYQEIFNHSPKSVGAWWIDAYSLNYLHDKYGITANLDVADQYSTDQYQVWGQYFSTPFYPTKQNALMPAQTPANKIGVVTIQWATRDPYNGYGNGATDSTYSVQVNDYLLHKLDVNYFEKILAIYPQVTVGLENDFNWDKNGPEYIKQIQLLKSKQQQGQLVLKTMSEFAISYQAIHPNLSPNVLIYASDPLGTDGKVVWYQNPRYRIGLFYKPEEGLFIRDLRTYSDGAQALVKHNSWAPSL